VQVLDRPASGPLVRHALVTAAAAIVVVAVIVAPVAAQRVATWIRPAADGVSAGR
jgi:cell division protein FtsW (lipid II flippase)